MKSQEGHGSTFSFTAQFEPGSHDTRKVPLDATNLRNRSVLVIDDNSTNRFILGETLKSWGMESTEFGVPTDALADLSARNATKEPYSLVLVDSEMPGLNGFETTSRIKQIAPELPVIMFTSDAKPGDILRRREAGLSGYAVKPVKRAELFRLLCGALQKKEGAESPKLTEPNPKETAPVQALRILMAEDSEDNRILLEIYFNGSPHKLTFADNGKAALDLYAVESFDLILMDMQMPVMDGLTATRAIRTLEKERGAAAIPIIALTANARRKTLRRVATPAAISTFRNRSSGKSCSARSKNTGR